MNNHKENFKEAQKVLLEERMIPLLAHTLFVRLQVELYNFNSRRHIKMNERRDRRYAKLDRKVTEMNLRLNHRFDTRKKDTV